VRLSAKRVASIRKHQSWSSRVTRESDALDLQRRVFTWRDPKRIDRSLRSAEHSTRRKARPYPSAMSMLNFYVNRGGRNLLADRRRILNRAKDELRRLFDRTTTSRRTIRQKRGKKDAEEAIVFLEAATVLPASQLHNFAVIIVEGHSQWFRCIEIIL
jgi:hypothetical protein